MRILQLSPTFGSIGGIETYIHRLCEALLSRGHQTIVATADLRPGTKTDYEVIPVPELGWQPGYDPNFRRDRILKLVCDYRSDCVLLHHVRDGQLLRILQPKYLTVEFVHGFACSGAKLFRRRDQTCEHAVGLRCLRDWYVGPCGSQASPRAAINNLRQARDYIRGLSLLDLVVVPSQFMKRYLIGEGIDKNRIDIVDMTMGIPPALPTKLARSREPHLVFVGRAVYAKGIQYLIRALSLLGPRYLLSVVGDGWYLSALKALATKLDLEGQVTFFGALQGTALSRVIDTATIAVVPSVYPDPAVMVVPEMRSHGLPVVVTNVGGLSEWASRFPSIYIAEPADEVSLAAAIRRAEEDSVTGLADAAGGVPQQLPTLLERVHAARLPNQRLGLGVGLVETGVSV